MGERALQETEGCREDGEPQRGQVVIEEKITVKETDGSRENNGL